MRRSPLSRIRNFLAAAAILLPLSGLALGQGLPPASPASAGFSSARLHRIDTVVAGYVRDHRIAGAVTLIARRGRTVHLGAYGMRDVESADPMRPDTIFRIASMSKAVTTVAALILMEEGRLLLSDPVSKYIPAFEKTTVLAPASSPDGSAAPVPAKRKITIRDLMTHTSGISYGTGNAAARYDAAGARLWYFADKDEPIGAVVDRIAAVPFEAQPGEKWIYGFSTDVLGRVVEVASGMPLDQFLQTRIFTPLRMPDTSFFLPPAKRSRLAAVYSAREDGRIERAPDHGRVGQGEYVDGPRRCFSGGAGLLSTASDYARFLQMLANGGALDGRRILSRKTVELATSNQVGSLYEEGRFGFGLGFRIVEHVGRAGRLGSPGEYGWGSAYYGDYWVDPQEGTVFLFLSQLIPPGDIDLSPKFHELVDAALEGEGVRVR